jgi:hypothetical protein
LSARAASAPGHQKTALPEPLRSAFTAEDTRASLHEAPPASSGLVPEYWNLRHIKGVIKAKLAYLEAAMNNLIYLVGLIVVILAVLSFFGLR